MAKTLAIGWDVAGWKESSSKNVFCVVESGRFLSFSDKNPSKWINKNSSTNFFDWLLGLNITAYDQVVLAIDAPLKFPQKFVELVSNKGDLNPHFDTRFFFRQCEIDIHKDYGKWPLSSVGSFLGQAAVLAQSVLKILPSFDNLRIIEVYPGICKVKFEKASHIIDTVKNQIRNFKIQDSERNISRDHEDALICAAFAQEYLADWDALQAIAHNPNSDDEGYIYYPGMTAP
jgi:predicted nuclease with RNAse H fold